MKMYQFKAKDSEIKPYPLCFGNIFFPHVLTCQCTLRAYIVTCHNALHGDMLMCEHALYAYVLTCQRALYAYILTCQYALHADMLKCQLLMFFFPVSVPLLLKLYTFDSLVFFHSVVNSYIIQV